MKKLRVIMYLFTVCAFLSACSGDDGDPGPQGQSGAQGTKGDSGDKGDKGDKGENGADAVGEYIKQGSIEGTITGARRDGTAINETFNYEYLYADAEYFDGDQVYLERYSSGSGIESAWTRLKKSGEALTAENFGINYSKELNANTILSLQVGAEFEDHSGFVLEIDPIINNSEYHFSNGGNSNNPTYGIFYYTTSFANQSAYFFVASVKNKTYYLYYSVATGSLISIREGSSGQVLTGDDPLFIQYNKLKFVEDPNSHIPVFFTVADDTNLSLSVPDTAADQLTITNYLQDATTGVITFDFTVKVAAYRSLFRGTNSTYHDITITGKFNSGGKVYSSIVGRVGG